MMFRSVAIALLLLNLATVKAQDSLATHIGYDISAETSVGTGDWNAYQLVANRHHAVGTRQNTASLRGAVTLEHSFGKDWKFSSSVDAIASVHADHKLYLQQCYAALSYDRLFVEAGSREQRLVVRNEQLSVGSFVKGINAKPIPQVHFGTSDFWNVPFTDNWLQAHFDFGYGKFLDSGYKDDVFNSASAVNTLYATGALYHQKHLYLRSNPKKRIFGVAGIEHVVIFGGAGHSYENGVLVTKEKSSTLRDCWNVLLPLGDGNYYENNAFEDWRYGNHIGMMTYQIGWNIDSHHQLQAYLDNPFEDGSGIRKGNGWDGLWGIEYSNSSSGSQIVRSAVVEFFQSTNQCGPLHWSSNDYPEPVRSQVTDHIRGNDNYYNHSFYGGYTHYGMSPGIGLIPSPIYNKDGCMDYRDNRVKAWHVGINGEITEGLSYVAKGSYREGWGTYYAPLAAKHHSFDAMLQGIYSIGYWQLSAAYAFDRGNVYGNGSTFNLKIGYHGKIL